MKKILVCRATFKEFIAPIFLLIMGFTLGAASREIITDYKDIRSIMFIFIVLSFILSSIFILLFLLKMKLTIYENGTLELDAIRKKLKFSWDEIDNIRIEKYENFTKSIGSLFSIFNNRPRFQDEEINIKVILLELKNGETAFFQLYFSNGEKFIELLLKNVPKEKTAPLRDLLPGDLN